MSEYEQVFGEWLVDTVTVETYQGIGPKGPVLSAPSPVGGVMVTWGNRLVRGSNSEERVSDAQITMPTTLAAPFQPESEVTLPDGQKRTVLSLAIDQESRPLAHARVVLV